MMMQLKTGAAAMPAMTGGEGNEGGSGGKGQKTKEEKASQWRQQETRELIAIRADCEQDFSLGRRNKTLWEAVSLRMRDKGYHRSPDQCKCKWKNLVIRYKDKETAEAENGRQCPFFEEIRSVFIERGRNMQSLLLESEAGTPKAKKNAKRLIGERLYEELSDEDEDEGDSDEERPSQSKKRKAEKSVQQNRASAADKSRATNSVHELLQDFMQKQQQIESHWWEMMERRAFERQRFEQEWRQSMEKLERERLMLGQAWREREEQRRMREDCRTEKRDTLLTALLNKLIQDDL